uniref:VOC family protein n=2 Tax=Candidatus Pelagibacter sp. TaxID=2024849 RepID=UPI004049CF4C
MIGYVMVGTNDLNKSITYYDTLLDLLNLKRVDTSEEYAGYAPKNNPDNIEFYVTKPANKKDANFGNGTQISFIANSKEIVDKFHQAGIELGGKSEGTPGERPKGSKVYYSYVRDLDGNKICAFTNL